VWGCGVGSEEGAPTWATAGAKGALRLFEGVKGASGPRLLLLAEGGEEVTSKVVALGPLLASALLVGAQGEVAGGLLSLASARVPLRSMFLATSGIFVASALHIHHRAREGNPNAYISAELLLATSAAFYLAMAVAGPLVIPLPQEWFLHPSLVWPILQDLIVVPLQLATLYWKAGSDLSSAAPAMALATMKTAAAIGTAVVSPYGQWCRLVSWSSFGMLAVQLQGLESGKRIRMISDLFVFCGLSALWAQTFVGLGYTSEQTAIHVMAMCDLVCKAGTCHLLTKQSPAQVEEEPMVEPPPEEC